LIGSGTEFTSVYITAGVILTMSHYKVKRHH